MLKYLNGNQDNFNQKLELLLSKRKVQESSKFFTVKKIIQDIKKNKDKALIKYESKFSKFKKINNSNIVFNNTEIKKIIKKLDFKTKKSIDVAFNRIYRFHKDLLLCCTCGGLRNVQLQSETYFVCGYFEWIAPDI